MKFVFSLAVLFVAAVAASAEVQRYNNYTVYRLTPSNVFQLSFLQNLHEEEGVDFWREPDQVNRNADIMLAPEKKAQMLKLFAEYGIQAEVMVPDVEK